jgi:hypothetical protein
MTGRLKLLHWKPPTMGFKCLGQNAPGVQQWFRALYAEGRNTPIERPCTLVLRLAAGDADVLSGRYLSVEDDLDSVVKEFVAEPSADRRMLRVLGVAAFSGK